MKILFLTPYPLEEAPSQRFRFEQYLPLLKGYKISVQSFLPPHQSKTFYSGGQILRKSVLLILGFAKRIAIIFAIPRYQYIFIHREAAPVGPPIFEWVIAKIFRKKIIYDFDDAIWLTDKINEGSFEKMLRWRSKISLICKWSYKVSAGNQYLCNYARQFNNQVVLNPTTIETENLHNGALYSENQKTSGDDNITIGWTGSHSTLKYLKILEPVLQKLEKGYPKVRFLVIADREPDLNLQRVNFLPWNKKTEAADLLKIDIGIMPLPDDEWTKGKCGFKALQYMAMEIPAVISSVGVNVEIINHGASGFLANTQEDWFNFLVQLIDNKELRVKLGQSARKKVIEHYSVSSNTAIFLSLFS